MLLYIFKFKFGFLGGGGPDDWWFGISPEGFGTAAMLINFIVALVVSRFTPAPPPHIKEIVANIRRP
jgi:cation/acetate symporter